jgi:hypothetical protein
MIEKSHGSSDVCGVGPAERTGKSRVTYWVAGERDPHPQPDGHGIPRETTGFAALGGTPVLLFVHVFEVGVCVGVVVDVECQVGRRADLEVGAVALVADADD